MRVTVTRKGRHVVAEWPGAAGLCLAGNPEIGVMRITCPICGERTQQVLVDGGDFPIQHRSDCRYERTIRRLVAAHPERVGERYSTLRVQLGGYSVTVRDSMTLRGDEDLDRDLAAPTGVQESGSGGRRMTVRR